MTHPALESPESRACVEALWAVNPEGAAELLAAFPEAVFEWLGEPTLEVERRTRAEGRRGAGLQGSSAAVGRLF
jgi:hypothetical protein